jgi:hypothetical protein
LPEKRTGAEILSEAYYEALQTIISEFKHITPKMTSTFIFNKNGETIAASNANEDQTKNIIANFNSISQHAENIGGIENFTIQCTNGQLNITSMNNLYLATVSSKAADPKIVKALTRVLVPTIVKLMDQFAPENQPLISPQITQTQDSDGEETAALPIEETEPALKPEPEAPLSFSSEPLLPQPPVNQFMVEKIGGFLVPPDIVRIDGEVVARWSDLYDGKEIRNVSIQTLEGKTTICKFKPIKENNAKGIIQVPERILRILQTGKGKLVMVKPVIL